MIYIIKQAGLYQNKVNSSLVSTCNCKMGILKNKLNGIDPSIDLKYRENTDHSSVSP